VLRPNSFKNFNEEVIMDFATLSAYDDFVQFGGRGELEGVHGVAPIEFDFKLCTSELKLLSNFKNFELDGVAFGGGEEMGILFQKHLTYEDDSLAIVLTEFHFVSA
jgi:hypothetical protein